MTHTDWLTSGNPQAMLEFLRSPHTGTYHTVSGRKDRQLRLFSTACACDHYDSGSDEDLGVLRGYEEWLAKGIADPACGDTGAKIASVWASYGKDDEAGGKRADFLRDVVGDPFRVTLQVCGRHSIAGDCPVCRRLRTPTVLSLAQAAYDLRRDGGTLDPVRLLVLADALEEAGCLEAKVLDHLRRPSAVHVRGCWALDLALSPA